MLDRRHAVGGGEHMAHVGPCVDDHTGAVAVEEAVAVTVGVLGLSWLSIFVAHDIGGDDARSLILERFEYLLVAAMITPLMWRRSRPLTVLCLVAPLSLLVFGLQVPDQLGPSIALFLAMYTAGALSRYRWRDPCASRRV